MRNQIADKFDEMRLTFLDGQYFQSRLVAEDILKYPDALSPFETDKARWHIRTCERYMDQERVEAIFKQHCPVQDQSARMEVGLATFLAVEGDHEPITIEGGV